MAALHPSQDTPELGARSRCRACGNNIVYVGPYWRHEGLQPRHIAVPDDFPEEVTHAHV